MSGISAMMTKLGGSPSSGGGGGSSYTGGPPPAGTRSTPAGAVAALTPPKPNAGDLWAGLNDSKFGASPPGGGGQRPPSSAGSNSSAPHRGTTTTTGGGVSGSPGGGAWPERPNAGGVKLHGVSRGVRSMNAKVPTREEIEEMTPTQAETQRQIQLQIQRLQTILEEMRHNAVAAERNLHELMFELKKKTEECERLKSQLQLTPHQINDAMKAKEPYDPRLEHQIVSLRKQAEALEKDISKDSDEKIMLLRRVDRQLNGGPAATLADTHLFTKFSRSRAASSFTRIVEVLPKGNVERLDDAQFFEYCKATVHAAVVQSQRRRTAVDVESALLTGLHHAGHRANLSRIIAAIDEEDLYKL